MTHGYEYFDFEYEGIDEYDFWMDFDQMEEDIEFDALDIYGGYEGEEQEYDIYEQDEVEDVW